MGERNWQARYWEARKYADAQAAAYEQGEEVDTYRGLAGAAWVAEAYVIATANATSLMQAHGKHWQYAVDQCKQLAEKYRQRAKNL